jgi:hypothetical protein
MARPRKSARIGARSNTTTGHNTSEDLQDNDNNNAQNINEDLQDPHPDLHEPQGGHPGAIPEEPEVPEIPVPLPGAQEKLRQIAMLVKSLSPEELLVLDQIPQNDRAPRTTPAPRAPRRNDQTSQQADSPASEQRSLHSPRRGNSKPSDNHPRRKLGQRKPQPERSGSKEHTIIPIEDDIDDVIQDRPRTTRFSEREIERMVQERLEQRLRSAQNPWARTAELQESLAACSPFCREIKEAQSIGQVPGRLPRYDGTTDPDDYIFSFTNIMNLYAHSAEFTAKLMVTTFEGLALDWFAKQPANSIFSFRELCNKLTQQFASQKRQKLPMSYLGTIHQQEGESLRNWLARFNVELLKIDSPNIDYIISILFDLTKNRQFGNALSRKQPRTFADIMSLASKYMTQEEMNSFKDKNKNKATTSNPKRHDRVPAQRTMDYEQSLRKSNVFQRLEYNKADQQRLNTSMEEILEILERNNWIPEARKIAQPRPGSRNYDLYCKYHRAHGHQTENCFHLKREVEKLIEQGKLDEYIDRDDRKRERSRSPRNNNQRRNSHRRTPVHAPTQEQNYDQIN